MSPMSDDITTVSAHATYPWSMVNGLVPPREAENAYDDLRTQRDALAEALRGLVDDGCLCAVNEREEPCESCARARAALAKVKP